jgi:hypothetical protein
MNELTLEQKYIMSDLTKIIAKKEPCKPQFDKLIEAMYQEDWSAYCKVIIKNRGWLKGKDIDVPIEIINWKKIKLPEHIEKALNDLDELTDNHKERLNVFGNDLFDQDDLNNKILEIRQDIENYLKTSKEDLEYNINNIQELIYVYEELTTLEDDLPEYFGCAVSDYFDEDWAEDYVKSNYDIPSFVSYNTNWTAVTDCLLEDYRTIYMFETEFYFQEY